ncbi:MAG: AAA family ATPase, partial [Bacteroidales bacterium]|nr:AAA family ATPase [Bacteroidales bacterium]
MELTDIQPLFDSYHRKLAKVDLRFKRYLYSQINWKARLIGIKGARGVGKTTMLLQHILENYKDVDQTLYVSLDDLWFSSFTLMDLVDWAYRHGIMRLYLDEVHRYENWAANLKNIYDNYPDMSIVYTSSSLLIMDNAKVDLSRRQTTYTLGGLSFREFLALEQVIGIEPISLTELLKNHVSHAMRIVR